MWYNNLKTCILILSIGTLSISLYGQSKSDFLFPWEHEGKLGYIDTTGHFSPTESTNLQYPKPKTQVPLLYPFESMGMYGFKNKDSQVVIEAGFEKVGDFVDGYAWVKLDHKRFYYIDKIGQPLLNFTFDRAYNFSDGMARVKDIYPAKSYLGYGFINTNGEVAIPLVYDQAMDFIGGFALVKNLQGWWLIDKKGNQKFGPCISLFYEKGNFHVK